MVSRGLPPVGSRGSSCNLDVQSLPPGLPESSTMSRLRRRNTRLISEVCKEFSRIVDIKFNFMLARMEANLRGRVDEVSTCHSHVARLDAIVLYGSKFAARFTTF